jgi:membrane-bound lytic murein transglycosylase D
LKLSQTYNKSTVESKMHRWILGLGGAFILLSFYGCFQANLDKTGMEIIARGPVQGSPSPAEAPPSCSVEEPGEHFSEASARMEPEETSAADDPSSSRQGPAAQDTAEDATGPVMSREDKEAALNRVLYLCRLSQADWESGDLEGAVDTLDQAYALLLSVDPENDPNLLQEKEDLRLTISRRILEIYSSRLVAANGKNRNEIPITINKHVQDEIDSFTIGRERNFFLESYRRAGRHRARIEAALQEAGLPTDLAWLPLIESGFKVTALSPARALGLWQFIPSTGYRYDLNRDKYIDERLDPEESTRGAIEYLEELHGMFGDWTTVLAAYNCGEHRVLQTIQRQNINYLDNFWDLYERLPRETARYVPRFLATLHIVQNPEKYGLDEVAVDAPLQYETVTVSRQTSLKSIARATGIDGDTLNELNAELRRGILPADGYDLRVPLGAGRLVAAKMDEFPICQVRAVGGGKIHKVRKGESLYSISKKYRVSIRGLQQVNDIQKPGAIRTGSLLRIPGNGPAERHTLAVESAPHRFKTIEYIVRPGDSLFKIAKRFATTTEKIQRLNKLSTTRLSVGQILKVQTSSGMSGEA